MDKPRELGEYRRVIEETLSELRRDDVAVGDVVERSAGTLAVTFSRWGHAQTLEVPAGKLQATEEARVTISRAVLEVSKAIEKRLMEPRITVARR